MSGAHTRSTPRNSRFDGRMLAAVALVATLLGLTLTLIAELAVPQLVNAVGHAVGLLWLLAPHAVTAFGTLLFVGGGLGIALLVETETDRIAARRDLERRARDAGAR